MNSRYLEAIAAGIITAIVAGLLGIGTHRTMSGMASSALAAPLASSYSHSGLGSAE